MKFAIALGVINLAVSGTILAVILVGARKAKAEMDSMRTKINTSFGKLKAALVDTEI